MNEIILQQKVCFSFFCSPTDHDAATKVPLTLEALSKPTLASVGVNWPFQVIASFLKIHSADTPCGEDSATCEWQPDLLLLLVLQKLLLLVVVKLLKLLELVVLLQDQLGLMLL